jgi:hypothetical protein
MREKTIIKTDLTGKKVSSLQNRPKRLQSIKEAAERHKMKNHSA